MAVDLSFLQTLIVSFFLPANIFVLLHIILYWYYAYFIKAVPIIPFLYLLREVGDLPFLILSIAAFLAFALQAYRNAILAMFTGSSQVFFLLPIYWILRKLQKRKVLKRKKSKIPKRKKSVDMIDTDWSEIYLYVRDEKIMSTDLGNVLFAVHTKLQKKYGKFSISESGWIKLLVKLPEENNRRIEEADNYFIFLLVCSFLSIVLSVELVIVNVLSFVYATAESIDPLLSIAPLMGSILSSVLFYKTSISLAFNYAMLVKSCFETSTRR